MSQSRSSKGKTGRVLGLAESVGLPLDGCPSQGTHDKLTWQVGGMPPQGLGAPNLWGLLSCFWLVGRSYSGSWGWVYRGGQCLAASTMRKAVRSSPRFLPPGVLTLPYPDAQ